MESLLPFLQGTRTPYNMPVYPGAQRIIAEALIEFRISTEKWDGQVDSGAISTYPNHNRPTVPFALAVTRIDV